MLLCGCCKQTLSFDFFDRNKSNSHRGYYHHECYICRKANRIRLIGLYKNMSENITWQECWEVFNLFEHSCFVCGVKGRLTLDHHNNLLPLKIGNAVVLCNKCNATKARKKPQEFYSTTQLEQLVFQYRTQHV